MQMTITLTEREVQQLQQMLERHRAFETKQSNLDDAIHECIRMAMYKESEEGA